MSDSETASSGSEMVITVVDMTMTQSPVQSSADSVMTQSSDTNDLPPVIDVGDTLHPTTFLHMRNCGTGVKEHANCKLVLQKSLIKDAGYGLFLKEGFTLNHGEVITEYSGLTISTDEVLLDVDALRSVRVGDNHIIGKRRLQLVNGDGFGSMINSGTDRFKGNCECTVLSGHLCAVVRVNPDYPIIGPSELYITAGTGWWATFRRVLNDNPEWSVEELNNK